MRKKTVQEKLWAGRFGKEYTDRNISTLKEVDEYHRKNYGQTRTEINNLFVGKLSRSIKILEVGANIGNQLLFLQKMGFRNLYGLEINSYTIEIAKSRTKNIYIIRGSALDIPFKDNYFDLVYTSGVLIHISPFDINKALTEIYRCTKRYIWGFEYYAYKYTPVLYRKHKNLLWKANFSKLFLNKFPNLKLVRQKILKYKNNDNLDIVYLLKKNN